NRRHYRGAVYVFARRRGAHAPTATLAGPGGELGFAVGVSGGTVVAGAPFAHGGAAYAFVRPRSGWAGTHGPSLRLRHPAAAREVGYAVAIAGATLAVGAPGLGA